MSQRNVQGIWSIFSNSQEIFPNINFMGPYQHISHTHFFHDMMKMQLFIPIEKRLLFHCIYQLILATFWPLNLFVPLSTKGPQIAYERSFRWKLAHFRYLCQVGVPFFLLHHSISCSVIHPDLIFPPNAFMFCHVFPQSNALPSHVKITVSRQTLFEDSFQQVRGSFSLNWCHTAHTAMNFKCSDASQPACMHEFSSAIH